MIVRTGRLAVAAVALALAACQPPARVTAPAPPAAAPPTSAVGTTTAPVQAPAKAALPSRDFLPGPLYYCAVGDARVAIEYDAKVESLCRRHPEMGPCQYERNACRARGGRVFTARGEEVSPGVEAEYDKAVMRVRFQSDGGKR